MPPAAQAVIDFWFGPAGSAERQGARPQWFIKDEAFDTEIATRFGPTIEEALRGEVVAWSAEPLSALAHILLLDQFTRNVFRGTSRAFAGDARALRAASAMVGAQQDLALPSYQRAFVYMPFEHAEGMAMQDESVRLFSRLAREDPALDGMLDYAHKHRAVIERFGRFPHRNEILGRLSTAEEAEYLSRPGAGF